MAARREESARPKTNNGTRRELWQEDTAQSDLPTGRLTWIRAELIDPNPRQPRKTLDRLALEELKASIAEQGILQPLLVVRQKPQTPNADTRYILIAGQRRLTAARELGKKLVPSFILSESDPQGSLLNAITENVQRRALAPWEEGESYRVLATEFNMTHAEIAQRLGKGNEAGRVYVAERISIAENLDAEARKILLNIHNDNSLLNNSQSVAQATFSDFVHNQEPSGELAYGIGVIRELSRIPRERQKEAAEAIRSLENQLGRKVTSGEAVKHLKQYRGEKPIRRGGGVLNPVSHSELLKNSTPSNSPVTEQPSLPGLDRKEPANESAKTRSPKKARLERQQQLNNRVALDELEIIRRWRGGSNGNTESLTREELIALLRQDLERLEGHEGKP